MIDLKTVELELAQARHARIAAERAGCEIEEMADHLRRTNLRHAHAARPAPPPARAAQRPLPPHLFVFSA